MDKKKKIILFTIIAIITIVIVAIGAYFIIKQNKSNEEIGKLNNYYDKLVNTDSYSFSTTLDDKNNVYYCKSDGKAYIDSNYKGQNSKYLIKDKNTYLLKNDSKIYYSYLNNEIDLYKIELQIKDIKEDNQGIVGKEKIENKTYNYEEFKGISGFYIGDTSNIDEENVKTRFYFKGDNLAYIKTIISDDNQQLLKIDFQKKLIVDYLKSHQIIKKCKKRKGVILRCQQDLY